MPRAACVLALVAGCASGVGAQPAQPELVVRAGAYVSRLLAGLANVAAEERYEQESTSRPRRRTLRSELVVVSYPGTGSWQVFREVLEVDGRVVGGSGEGRLAKLFLGPAEQALARARDIDAAGARHNIGEIGTLNNPLLVLAFLQRDYRERFRFTLAELDRSAGPTVRMVQFEEARVPTILRLGGNLDMPAKGLLWIDETDGRVLKTELRVGQRELAHSSMTWRPPSTITTTFGLDEKLGIDVPREMRDHYALQDVEIRGVATYSRFRRFPVRTARPDRQDWASRRQFWRWIRGRLRSFMTGMVTDGRLETNRRRMAELLDQLASSDGMHRSSLDGVSLGRVTCHLPRSPVLYEPSIYIVARGRKIGYVGDRAVTYDANNYLVLAAPLPFECQTEPGVDGPMLGLSVRVAPGLIGDLASRMPPHRQAALTDAPECMEATPLEPAMSDAAVRLVECLASPVEAEILGPGIVREIVYRALCGPQGPVLLAMIGRHGQTAQINTALRWMHARYAEPFSVSQMAGEVGMSVSAFHHRFKAATASSPVQYLKSVRLHKARDLIVNGGAGAAEAAVTVGYESASQFSREFKRFFGATPSDEARRLRTLMGRQEPVDARLAG